jgi:cbb3-type cytochrome oxidase maturation protein
MEIIYLLIPLAILLAGIIIAVFFWAVKSGQFDDLEGPAHRILMDEDDNAPGVDKNKSNNRKVKTTKP